MCLKPINRTLLLELKRSPAVVPSGELLNELQALGLLCKPPSPIFSSLPSYSLTPDSPPP